MENREKEFLNSYYIYDNTVFGSHEETYQLDALLKEYSDQQNKAQLEEIERLKQANQQKESDIKRLKSIQSQETTRADDFQNEVERLKSELKAAEWISVEDRLPEIDNNYIVFRPDFIEPVRTSEYSIEYGKFLDHRITHWMPLPNKPKTN